jgi:hypothetical protein
MNKKSLREKLSMFVLMALLLAVIAPAVPAQDGHEGHDMSNMGTSKSKSKSKPKSKPKPKPTPAKPAQNKNEMPGMNMATSTPTPQPSPSPSPMQMNMPGMQMPAAAPQASPQPVASPQPATTPQTDINMPMPQASPTPVSGGSQSTQQPKSSTGHEGHDMGNMNTTGAQPTQGGGAKGSMPGMNTPGMSGMGKMDADSLMVMSAEGMDIRVGRSSSGNSIAMGQMGSGTSWQPGTTPMYMWYTRAKGWLVFFHGDVKMGVNSQGGPRGVTKVESQNWFMPMAFRRVGPGTLQLRGMFSLEGFTFPQGGSGQLFQTGETYKGRPIIDAQHPHDLFMELSATYTVPIGERATWFAYLGYPGEPALGPTAFMHRMSASENPAPVLSHHLQDSTHITFGVFTTGFTYRWLKFEGSVFNGREPGENRYDLEAGPWNSRSFRVSFAPNANWAMQWSYGWLKNPETLEEGDVRRMTASVSYNKRFDRGNWATSLLWGRNRELHHLPGQTLNGYTAESTVNFLDRNYLYTRLELVDKGGLLNRDERTRLGITDNHPLFRIGAYTFGYSRDVWTTDKLAVALGGDFTFYSKPAVLDPIYGSNPTSYKFFIRIRPNKMSMSGHTHGNMSGAAGGQQ